MFKSSTTIFFVYHDNDKFETLATICVAWLEKHEMYVAMLCSATGSIIASGYFREWSNVLGFLSKVEALPKNDKSFVSLVKIELAERNLRIKGCPNE